MLTPKRRFFATIFGIDLNDFDEDEIPKRPRDRREATLKLGAAPTLEYDNLANGRARKLINRAIQNGRYSSKISVYPQSKYLLIRCQASNQSGRVGGADKITTTAKSLEVFPIGTWKPVRNYRNSLQNWQRPYGTLSQRSALRRHEWLL